MIDEQDREHGRSCLKLFIEHPKNIDILEKNIFTNYGDTLQNYNTCIFDVIHALSDGLSLSEIQGLVKAQELQERNPIYQELLAKQKEEDDFVTNPYNVEEGALECRNCGSKRTISFSKQTRSGDEPLTVYVKCVNCKQSWTN